MEPSDALKDRSTFGRLRDQGRLSEIADLDLFSSETQRILDDIVKRAAEQLRLPISLVTVVLDHAQHFAASQGLNGWLRDVGGTPVEWSFCAHAVQSGEPFVVEDARTHPAVKDIPLVEHDGVRCYAGVPLITPRGYPIGTLCVVGSEARTFSEDDLAALRALADEALERIEARRKPE